MRLRDRIERVYGDRIAQGLFVFVAVFASYYWSAPRTVVLEDDGLFIVAGYFNAIAHSPGYPVYTALAHLATLVPLGSVAMRVHMLSAVLGALACVVLWRIALSLIGSGLYAAAAALAFGFSTTFWSQSIIAEVYSLNALLFFLLAAGGLTRAPHRPDPGAHFILGLGLLYGLSLSNHWPLLLLSTPALAILYWPDRRALLRHWAAFGGGILLGLLPYAWLVFRTHVVPEYCMIGPIRSWSEFWYYLSREGYYHVDFSPSADWHDKLQFAGFTLRQLAVQFGPAGAAPIALGFVMQWRTWPLLICLALLAAFAGNTLVLIGLLGFDFDLLHRNLFRVYPLLAFAVAALWLGLGIQFIGKALLQALRRRVTQRFLHGSIAIFIVATTWMQSAPANYRAEDRWAERYTAALFDALPPEAVLFGSGDTVAGPGRYFHLVEGRRQDLSFHWGSSLQLAGKVYRLYQMQTPKVDALMELLLRGEPGKLYYTTEFPIPVGHEDFGLFMKARTDLPKDRVWVTALPAVIKYLEWLRRQPVPADPWEYMHYLWLRLDHCRVWANLEPGSLPASVRSGDYAPCDHYSGRLFLVRLMLEADMPEVDLMLRLLDEATGLRAQAVTRKESSELSLLRGMVLLRKNRIAQAIEQFRESQTIWPHPKNPAAASMRKAQAVY